MSAIFYQLNLSIWLGIVIDVELLIFLYLFSPCRLLTQYCLLRLLLRGIQQLNICLIHATLMPYGQKFS